MTVEAQTWKLTHEKNATECKYRMQVNGIKGAKERTRVEKAMVSDQWSPAGEAWNPNTREETLFFSKDFGDVKKFLTWGKAFQDFPLVELDKDGDIKKYVKIGPRSDSDNGKRICGKCGVAGHNARTCGTSRAVKSPKTGTRRCGNCGERGHNTRRCQAAKVVVVKAKKVKGKRQCKKCQGYGHNSATCGKPKITTNSSTGVYKCGGCGQEGHNRRKCPNK